MSDAPDPARCDDVAGTSPIRLVLVDDQELVRAGLRMVFGARPEVEVVGEAVDSAEVVDIVGSTSPHVVLMDVRMPGMDGIAATRAIREAYGSRADGGPGVLILTAFDLDEYVYEALRAGAGSFLVKDSLVEDLLTGIGRVHLADAIVGPRSGGLRDPTLADLRRPGHLGHLSGSTQRTPVKRPKSLSLEWIVPPNSNA